VINLPCFRFHKESLINFIDTPGHRDLSAEVTAALRIVDGALLVVDYSVGSNLQTETMLRWILAESVRPTLAINKLDLLLLEKDVDKEAIYQSLKGTIDNINDTISSFPNTSLGDVQLFPERGNVAFTSGLHGWGFTLRNFARRYEKKFGIAEEKIMGKLWGENFFNGAKQTWGCVGTDTNGKPLERAFNMFVLDPILKIVDAVTTSDQNFIDRVIVKLGLQLSDRERGLKGNEQLNAIMRNFLPIGKSLSEMLVVHLPSPSVAQRYRVETVYEGPMDQESSAGIRECNPKAPLVIYVSSLLPGAEKYSLGRVFSGTISAGCEVRVQGPNCRHSRKDDVFITTIGEVLTVKGCSFESIDSCVAGNIVVLSGVDKLLFKSGTITTSDNTFNIRTPKIFPTPVQVSVEVNKPADLPSLLEGLIQLSKSDLGIQTWLSETGEHIVAGAGEFHLEKCLNVSIPLYIHPKNLQ
jgi:elongation factor 2